MKKLLGRVLIALPIIVLQILWFIGTFRLFKDYAELLMILLQILAFLLCLYIISKREEGTYKILWLVFIMTLPVAGVLTYLMIGNKGTGRRLKLKLSESAKKLSNTIPDNTDIIEELRGKDKRVAESLNHIYTTTGFPLYRCADTKYYPLGEDMFADMCEELEKAERFVYIEYFIIQGGKFWDTMVDILARKAASGVDVRVMYDDFGSITTYSLEELAALNEKGIKTIAFNPFFLLSSQLNNRDHRKLMVIDGRVAFSGGVNIADEYINEIVRFGKWKDIGFKINGEAVKSYTYMFVEFWNAFALGDPIKKESIIEYDHSMLDTKENGYIMPYYDDPTSGEATSNVFFTEVLSLATDYVYFYTPYLMLGDTLYDAFIRAAERGVDVRLILPGIPDKKLVYKISRSYYRPLLEAGVKIYEYTPGFVHAKAFISDDKLCGIGTVNLDYRSLFLHFECFSAFYGTDIAADLKKDMEECFDVSKVVELKDTDRSFLDAISDGVLRVVAPLM